MWDGLIALVRRLTDRVLPSARDRDMEQEMRFHVEALVREHMAAGMSEAEARRRARRRFGSVARLKDRGHDVRGAGRVEDVVRDVRLAARGLRRNPGFAVAVVVTLALGIGGNTAIFSVVDQLLLRPLPYPNGDRLVMIHEVRVADREGPMSVSPANWLDWQRQSRTLEDAAAWSVLPGTLTGGGDPMRVNMQSVSAEFFPLLGVQPLIGRTILPDDDQPNAPRVAVLSHGLWQQRFGGDAGVIGRVVQVNDVPVEVIGVMPAAFRFVYADTHLWTAYRLDRSQPWRETAGRFHNVVARVRPDTAIDTARIELVGIAGRLAETHAFNRNTSVEVVPLREEITGEVQGALLFLYGAVGVLLAIGCFNVASLMLARGAARHREIAVRRALGAGRLPIVRQLLVESLLLALAGGAVGVALARWSLDALMAFAPPELLGVPDLSIDRRVFLYAVGLSVVTGMTVGLAPALAGVHRSMADSLRASWSSAAHLPRIRQALVVAQVALTVILLCAAGLLVRTVVSLDAADTGFDERNLLTMEVALPAARYDAEARARFYRDALDRVRGLSGVEAAAAANSLPVVGSPRGGTAFHRRGTPELPMMERPGATIRVVTPGYFEALEIPVLRGREFSVADEANPTPGFVVNEAFARTFLADVDPLAASLTVWMQAENPYLPVLGVVGDVSEGSIRDGAEPTIFYSQRQMAEPNMTLFVRADRPARFADAAVAIIRDLDPNLAVTNVRTLESAFADSLARERLSALVSGSLAVVGLLLAALGLYGLLAFQVTERTREIGIRMALGARLGRLVGGVVGGAFRLLGLGAALGVAGSLVLSRSLSTLLFGVTPYDVATYVAVLTLLAAVAGLASFLPARRATRVEPLVALRQD